MDIAALRSELTTDPLARGYAGMSDAQAAESLNTADRDLAEVSAIEVARHLLEEGRWPHVKRLAAKAAPYSGATDNQQAAAETALALFTDARLDAIRLNRPKVQAMLDLLVAAGALSAGDKTALSALYQNKRSRAQELGLPPVKVGHVTMARAA